MVAVAGLPGESLARAVSLFHETAPDELKTMRLGGETAMAAMWHHRMSTDIDLACGETTFDVLRAPAGGLAAFALGGTNPAPDVRGKDDCMGVPGYRRGEHRAEARRRRGTAIRRDGRHHGRSLCRAARDSPYDVSPGVEGCSPAMVTISRVRTTTNPTRSHGRRSNWTKANGLPSNA